MVFGKVIRKFGTQPTVANSVSHNLCLTTQEYIDACADLDADDIQKHIHNDIFTTVNKNQE